MQDPHGCHSSKVSIGVLMGGRGTRMGGIDKGLVRHPIAGVALITELLRVTSSALHRLGHCQAPDRPRLNTVMLAGRQDQRAQEQAWLTAARAGVPHATHMRFLVDERTGCGPLAGLVELLESLPQTANDWLLLLSCDLGFVDASVPEFLLASLFGQESHTSSRAQKVQAIVPSTADGQLQPTCALLHCSAAPQAQKALADGRYGLRRFIGTLQHEIVTLNNELSESMYNLNTPEDLARYAAACSASSRMASKSARTSVPSCTNI